MCYKKRVFLTRGGEGTSGGRVPPALSRPRAHGAGQGQRCEVLRRGEIVVSPGSRWPQLRTNSSPISPGLPSGSAAGPRTHGSAVEAPRTRVPVLHPCCRRQSKRKKKKMKNDCTELKIDMLAPKQRAAEARCALLPAAQPPAGVTGASPEPQWPWRSAAPGLCARGGGTRQAGP